MTKSMCINVQLIVYKIVIGTKWQTVTLDDRPNPFCGTDTDGDKLSDWREIDTKHNMVTFNSAYTKVKLPTVWDVINNSALKVGDTLSIFNTFHRFLIFDDEAPTPQRKITEDTIKWLKTTEVLPVKSNPAEKYSAYDGYSDFDKDKVFKDHGIKYDAFYYLEFTFETKKGTERLGKGEKEAMFVGVHEVTLGFYHTSVVIFATPFSELYDFKTVGQYKNGFLEKEMNFKKVGSNRLRAMTFGAGSGDMEGNNSGNLIAEINRDRDIEMHRKTEMIRIKVSNVTNTFYVLVERNGYFMLNHTDVKYKLFPKTSEEKFNSNSYVRGLLGSASLTSYISEISEDNFKIPGWGHMVYRTFFGLEF